MFIINEGEINLHMSHSQVNIFSHLTWTTKESEPHLISEDVLKIILEHISENAKKKNIRIEAIGGAANHVHALVKLPKDKTIANVVMHLKGESSHWIKRNVEGLEHFRWQTGYDARSVNEEGLDIVRHYILNQEFETDV